MSEHTHVRMDRMKNKLEQAKLDLVEFSSSSPRELHNKHEIVVQSLHDLFLAKNEEQQEFWAQELLMSVEWMEAQLTLNKLKFDALERRIAILQRQ